VNKTDKDTDMVPEPPMNLFQQKIRILIADDHEIFRLGMATTISSEENFELVGQAKDGVELIELAEKIYADVIIADQMMPKMSGTDALAVIKKKRPTVKTILFTVLEERSLIEEVEQGNIDGYLLKSQIKTHIVNAIRSVVEGKTVHPTRVDIARPDIRRNLTGSPLQNLTDKELQVLRLLTTGKTYKQAADALGISVKTIEFHRANITEKLGKKGIAELTRMAIAAGIISQSDISSDTDPQG
jgi:DNA-binding NarL/FixJ family response regulator